MSFKDFINFISFNLNRSKRILLATSLFIFSNFVFAENKNINFSFTPSIGFSSEKVQEYVFNPDETVLSRLDYSMPIFPTTKIELNLSIYNAFIRAFYDSAIPVKSGILEDYDFSSNGKISQYSNHNLFIDKNYSFNVKTGYRFNIDRFFIEPAVAFTYKNFKLTATDGYFQYPAFGDWSVNTPTKPASGNIISYEQQQILPSINLQIGFSLSNDWSFFVDSAFFPYLTIDSVDNHYLRTTQFIDKMRGGAGFYVALGAQYKNVSLNISYSYLQVLKSGESYTKQMGLATSSSLSKIKETPGTTDSTFSLFIKYRFF